MTSSEINLNAQNCIVKTYEFGAILLNNICNGSTARVQWGMLDYIGVSGLLGFGFLALAMVAVLVFAMLRG